MRKNKLVLFLLFFVLVFGTASMRPVVRTEAALTNVTKAPKAKAGNWTIDQKGYRYKYKASGKYAKDVWLNINGNIYYFLKTGYLQTGWKTYNNRRYYFDKQGIMVTGWKTISGKKYYFWKSKKELSGSAAIGKVSIASKYYYFNANNVMKTGWVKINGNYYYFYPSNGSMAVNTTVGNYKVDKDGKRITTTSTGPVQTLVPEQPAAPAGKVDCWVGDSRTVGMASAKGITITGSSMDTVLTSTWIGKVGMGYSWYKSTAESKVKSVLKKNPTATIVFNFGINDFANIEKYIEAYNSLMKSYPKARIFIMSVNPIDTKKECYLAKTSLIKDFNKKMKAAFPAQYIDCYSYLTKNGFETCATDGIHYTAKTYLNIYDYVLSKV